MKALKRELQSVVKNLKSLAQKTEKIANKLDKLGKAEVVKKPMPKARAKVVKKTVAKKAARVTASDTVLRIINRRKKGVNTSVLKDRTGFNDKKIWNIINRLKQQGKIKSDRRGSYIRV